MHLLLTLPDLLSQGFGRAFKLEIAVAGGGEVAVEEPAEEKDEDDDVVAGPAVVTATGPGSSSTRFITCLKVNTPTLSMSLILELLNISCHLGSGELRLFLSSRCPRGDAQLVKFLQQVIFL